MNLSNLSIRARIYLSMLIIVILSFIVIGGFTYFHFKEQNEDYHKSRLQRKESAVIKSIGYFLEKEGIYENTDSVMISFSDKITQLADVNNLHINIYSLNGNLLITSYTKHPEYDLFGFELPHEVIVGLKSGEERVVIDKKQGVLDILTTYSYMLNPNGDPIAVINIPYTQNLEENEREITTFITRLAEIYIVLFIGASFIAFFLSRYIVNTLNTITVKIQNIDLGKKNEPIEWKTKDELGILVIEYNRMLAELEKSAELLAQSERESAWREMAKQVAHEIKNPLTPMKLSVQHLQSTLKIESEDKEKFERFATTIIQQIDELSNIASAFSNFAKMPQPNPEQMDLVETITHVVELYQGTINANIQYESFEKEATILGDKGQVARAINNLIKNAAQATNEVENPKIEVSLRSIGSYFLIKVKDNGIGMNEEELSKAFIPNFTTKSSGMGLGLPMVKNIVNNTGGKVEIASKKGKETVVSIYFPSLYHK